MSAEKEPQKEKRVFTKDNRVDYFIFHKDRLLAGRKQAEFRVGKEKTLILYRKEGSNPSARLRNNTPILDERNNRYAYTYTDLRIIPKMKIYRGAFIVDDEGNEQEWDDDARDIPPGGEFRELTAEIEDEYQKEHKKN